MQVYGTSRNFFIINEYLKKELMVTKTRKEIHGNNKLVDKTINKQGHFKTNFMRRSGKINKTTYIKNQWEGLQG